MVDQKVKNPPQKAASKITPSGFDQQGTTTTMQKESKKDLDKQLNKAYADPFKSQAKKSRGDAKVNTLKR